MNEAQTREDLINPAIRAAGWTAVSALPSDVCTSDASADFGMFVAGAYSPCGWSGFVVWSPSV
jgi:hypothetical protein